MLSPRVIVTLMALLCAVLPGRIFSQNSNLSRTFSFSLKSNATTSAGVFKSDGTLLRTLWSNKQYLAGAFTEQWDGLSDEGTPITDSISVKVLSSGLKYEWEGLIGNTSDSLTGTSKWRGAQGLYDMAVSGNNAYLCANYSEGWSSNYKVDLLHPQSKMLIQQGVASTAWGASGLYVATDDKTVYWASTDPNDLEKAYVFGTNVSDDEYTTFSRGVSITNAHSRPYSSVIDVVLNSKAIPTGIAVQKKGRYLFVAHGRMNEIHVLSKISGQLVTTIKNFTNPRSICVDGDDNLWVISGINSLAKYAVNNNNGTLTSTGISILGLLDPLKMSISPDHALLAVIDGSTSQQIKAYSNTGTPLWTLGRAGGYQSDATVYDDKFYITNRSGYTNLDFTTFIAFQTDGSFWVGDGGNYRVQHFAANRSYIDNIMFYPRSYSAAVDPNNPTRVFNGFMEYEIDYSKALDNGKNGSWKLVRQWRDGVPNAFFPGGFEYHMDSNIFENLVTLSNGRTYAVLFRPTPKSPNEKTRYDLFELPASGNLRRTGISFIRGDADRISLMPDGSIRIFRYDGSRHGSYTWKSNPLTGFDANDNPVWGAAVTLATIPAKADFDPFEGTAGNRITSGGIIPSFDIGVSNDWRGAGYHLAGIKAGDNKWSFKTSKATSSAYTGDFPTDGAFDVGNSVKYPGGNVWTIDSSIFWNYRGENWKQSQTNKWNQYHESGLMIGQFGVTTPDFAYGAESPAMVAGNVFSGSIVKVNGVYYLYFQEESPHSGLHRWKISNLNSVKIQTAVFTTPDLYKPDPGIDLLAGLPAKGVVANNTAGWTRSNGEEYTHYTKYFSITTGSMSYDASQPSDLLIKYAQPLGSKYWVARSLGNNTNLLSWSLNGVINWRSNTPNETLNTGSLIDVLDNNGKIIVRFYPDQLVKLGTSYTRDGSFYGYVNNETLIGLPFKEFGEYTGLDRNISITAGTSGVDFTYGDYSLSNIAPYDPTANWRSPASFKWTGFTTSGPNNTRTIDIKSLRFAMTADSTNPFTPDIVNLSPNHNANTLTASHALGSSEIVVSENDGPFLPYTGTISIGNVAREAGYWKFKIKGEGKRQESKIANSPEFINKPITGISIPPAPPVDSDNEDIPPISGTTTPSAPTLVVDDVANTVLATHPLGESEIVYRVDGSVFIPYTGQINVGDRDWPAGFLQFKIKAGTGRNESPVSKSPAFSVRSKPVAPVAPTVVADNVTNTLIASHILGSSEIVVSENGEAFVAYTAQISVGNVARAAGYWKFKVKAANGRNESDVVNSPQFTIASSPTVMTTPVAPTLLADNTINTLSASHALGNSEMVVSENGGAFLAYTGKIHVGNNARAAGYWKFKVKAANGRNESDVANSPEFTYTSGTEVTITPGAPTLVIDEVENTISATHVLGLSEIVYSVDGSVFVPYQGAINVGERNWPAGFLRFKIKAATGRNESPVANSPAFSVLSTPVPPTVVADNAANTLSASHALGNSEIVVSESGGAFVAYTGQINVGNKARGAGYWKFKVKAANGRNESDVVNSTEFTFTPVPAFTTAPVAPTLVADDGANTISASHSLGDTEIVYSVNGSIFVPYRGEINVGQKDWPAGFLQFKIKSATGRTESGIAYSPAFSAMSTPIPPTVVADNQANTLSASHALGNSEIVVSENGGAFVAYTGQINVGNVERSAEYWKFKVKAANGRTESGVSNSPAFSVISTPVPPTVVADNITNTLTASHYLGTSEIVVSANGGLFVAYAGQINVGNIARAAGYWKFKVKAANGRYESDVAKSPEFTSTSGAAVTTTPAAPTLVVNDVANTISATHSLGESEIIYSVDGSIFLPYRGEINVGEKDWPAGFLRFKIKVAAGRNESAVVNSPKFTNNKKTASFKTSGDGRIETIATVVDEGSMITINDTSKTNTSSITESPKLNKDTIKGVSKPGNNILSRTDRTMQSLFDDIKSKGTKNKSFTVYPNPMTGNSFSLRLKNFQSGKYQLLLVDADGNIVVTKAISYSIQNAELHIKLDNDLSNGVYFLKILGKYASVTERILKN
jgi:hypothetical protein